MRRHRVYAFTKASCATPSASASDPTMGATTRTTPGYSARKASSKLGGVPSTAQNSRRPARSFTGRSLSSASGDVPDGEAALDHGEGDSTVPGSAELEEALLKWTICPMA